MMYAHALCNLHSRQRVLKLALCIISQRLRVSEISIAMSACLSNMLKSTAAVHGMCFREYGFKLRRRAKAIVHNNFAREMQCRFTKFCAKLFSRFSGKEPAGLMPP